MNAALVAGGGGLLILGLPIYLVLGVTAAVLLFVADTPMIAVTQKIVDELNSQTLIAVPFFVVAATFMERGGVAKALIDAALSWVGQVRGGLGIVCVIACTIFAAMCGSSVATALAMGTILVPAMLREGYERKFAAGIVGSSGTLGILIPPSLAMVVYGVLADESVPRLFLAGVIPGILQALLISGWIIFYARRKGYRFNAGQSVSRGDFVATNLRALPALSIPVIVLGGIYGGIATVTEAAALSAVAAILVSIICYRTVSIAGVVPLIALATRNAATIMIIIVTALIFGHWVTESGATAAIVDFARAQELNAATFLVFVTLLFFVLGMFLEVFSVLLIALPVLIPLLPEFGINPIQFGVIVTINMELALLTPPVGLNLFVLSSITKAPLAEVIAGIWPFVVLIALLLLAVMVMPGLSLWLPTLVLG
ncbi:TRAP transporter large permease [Acuticoccus yangtzensis]|uniref:TRAP transporter large permease n=1 Tax=Acuticoccus yangtzensis TaxID=1443441 RepID=UPI000949AABE|nr:TRAP transporter large permease [Acuticoccus yangtzensis]